MAVSGAGQDTKAGRRSKWDVPADQTEQPNALSATNAARERAAKINAMLAAKGKLAKEAPPQTPVIPAVTRPSVPVLSTTNQASNKVGEDLFMEEVEINDSPLRTILCKGTTQEEINRYSGAAVSTRGRYMSHKDKKEAEQNDSGERPLYLSIQGSSQEKVNLAVKRVKEIMGVADKPGVPPTHQHTPQTFAAPTSFQSATTYENNSLPPGMHYVQDKVFVGLDHAPQHFNVKDKLLGPNGSYFEHITRETGAKVQLRGKGSGFIEPTSGKEAFEALYVYISHSKVDGLRAAKKLVENLLETVHTEFHAFDHMKQTQYSVYPPHTAGYPVLRGYLPSYQTQRYGYPPPGGAANPPGFIRPVPPSDVSNYSNPSSSSQPVAPPAHIPPPPARFAAQAPPCPPRGFPSYGPSPVVPQPRGLSPGSILLGGLPAVAPPPTVVSPNTPQSGVPAAPYPVYPNTAYPVASHSAVASTRPLGGPPSGLDQQPHPPTPTQQPSMPPPVSHPVTHGQSTSSASTSNVYNTSADHDHVNTTQEQSKRRFTEKVRPEKILPQSPSVGVSFNQQSPVSPQSQAHLQVKSSKFEEARSGATAGAKDRKNSVSQAETQFKSPMLPLVKMKSDKIKVVMPLQSSPLSSSKPTGRKHGLQDVFVKEKEGVVKKKKKEELRSASSGAIASLAAYGEGDSSDEESTFSDDRSLHSANGRSSSESHSRPFWAVRH